MAKPGQGFALDPPGAKPLDLKYMKVNGFPKAVGFWSVPAVRLRAATAKRWPWLSLSVNHQSGWHKMRSRGSAPGGVRGEALILL